MPDSSRLSVSSCRISRARDAPIDRRTEIFAIARRGARQQQVGDVRADDQQQQHDDDAEDGGRSRRGACRGRRCRARRSSTSSCGTASPRAGCATACAASSVQAGHVGVHAGARGLLERAGEVALHLFERRRPASAGPRSAATSWSARRARLRGLAQSCGCRRDELRFEHERHRDIARRVRQALNADERRRQHADDGDRRCC